ALRSGARSRAPPSSLPSTRTGTSSRTAGARSTCATARAGSRRRLPKGRGLPRGVCPPTSANSRTIRTGRKCAPTCPAPTSGHGATLGPGDVRAVLYSAQPAELIVTQGAPPLKPVPNTQLSKVDNTESDLYYEKGDGNYYYLTSGRWFRAASLNGPWSFASK